MSETALDVMLKCRVCWNSWTCLFVYTEGSNVCKYGAPFVRVCAISNVPSSDSPHDPTPAKTELVEASRISDVETSQVPRASGCSSNLFVNFYAQGSSSFKLAGGGRTVSLKLQGKLNAVRRNLYARIFAGLKNPQRHSKSIH